MKNFNKIYIHALFLNNLKYAISVTSAIVDSTNFKWRCLGAALGIPFLWMVYVQYLLNAFWLHKKWPFRSLLIN